MSQETRDDAQTAQPAAVTAVWEQRFRAPSISLPVWSPSAPDRFAFTTNEGGTWQLYAWEPKTQTRRRATNDPVGIVDGSPTPDGRSLVWFNDEKGDEFGHYLIAPFEGGDSQPLLPGIPDGWPSGLAMRENVVAVAQGERKGFAVYVSVDGEPAREIFRHEEIVHLGGGVEHGGFNLGGISASGLLLCFEHAEHGDPLHRALRVVNIHTGQTVGDLWDGEGKGLVAWAWSPVPGDQRLAIVHELEDRERPALWNPVTGLRIDLHLDLPGNIHEIWDWFPDGKSLLVARSHDSRDELLRVFVPGGEITRVPHPDGTVTDARVRPDGDVWLRATDGAHQSRVLSPAGLRIIEADGEPAPDGRPYESWEFTNPQGRRVHGFIVKPHGGGPYPLLVEIHGGPTWQWYDAFAPEVQTWVDHGFAVALINYRGSTGYGARWRDGLIGNPGFPELEDSLAGLDDLIDRGLADPERVVITGDSWGGYLTLLGIGRHPDRWRAAVAGVPVADYFAAFEDEAPSLQAMDRGLFGGRPDELPDMYRERSPLTYIDAVRTPLLILAGANDSRCPIRQIDNYVAAAQERNLEIEVYRYDTGHSSFVVDERVRQMAAKLDFVLRHVGTVPA